MQDKKFLKDNEELDIADVTDTQWRLSVLSQSYRKD